MAVVEPQATPLTTAEPTEQARMLRSQDGGLSEAPAFLQPREPRPEAAADETSKARPKRRRAPTSFKEEGGTTAPEAEEA